MKKYSKAVFADHNPPSTAAAADGCTQDRQRQCSGPCLERRTVGGELLHQHGTRCRTAVLAADTRQKIFRILRTRAKKTIAGGAFLASAVVVFLRFQSSTLSRLFPAPSAALTSVAASKSHPKSQPSRSTSSALSLRHYKSSDTRLLLIYQSNQHPQYRRCRHDHPSPPSHAASPTHRTASPSRLRSRVTLSRDSEGIARI